jgi:hypothetical protein
MEVCSQFHTLVALLHRKEPPAPIEWKPWCTTELLRTLCMGDVYPALAENRNMISVQLVA